MLEIRSEINPSGYRLSVCKKKVGIFDKTPVYEETADWNGSIKEISPHAAFVIGELEQESKLRHEGGKVFLTFADAAKLQNSDAEAIGLLPPFPFQLDIQSQGNLGNVGFSISCTATRNGVRIPGEITDGVFRTADKNFRLSGLLYEVLDKIKLVNSQDNLEGKIAAFSELRLLLPEAQTNSHIQAQNYLLRIRISHVTAIGLNPSAEMNFDPIPMRRKDMDDHEAGAEPLTPPVVNEVFAKDFRSQVNVNSTYVLTSGQYLYIDPAIRLALRVIKQKQNAPLEERVSFLMSPSKAISEAYRKEGQDEAEVPIGDTIFFETAEYSERIDGIGEWIPPNLPYLESQTNNWLPERFSVVLAGKLVTGSPDDVPDWISAVKAAQSAGHQTVELNGVTLPASEPNILPTLQRLQPPEVMPGADPAKPPPDPITKRVSQILRAKNNFEDSQFKKGLQSRRLDDTSLPLMNAQLKEHQRDGVNWLVNCYQMGWPGVLLADDMGLGKTLQSLTFLMLLRRENVVRSGRPAIVVAPTSLLRNWQDEHSKHTIGEGLGKPLVAYGNELKHLRLVGNAAMLDSAEIARSKWILTTYETVRDYHMSFARVRFSVAVLDEIQKAKNPATRINATLRTLNIDFVLAMTGTPVENSISDLWAIGDITSPGYFPPLKEFMKQYGKSHEADERRASLEKLSKELLEAVQINGALVPPFALRRLKEDVAKDLPTKHQPPMKRAFMPTAQAERYAQVSAAAQTGQTQMLRALHDFRSISLHPADPDAVTGGMIEGDTYIAMSARLSQAFAIVAAIEQKREKVIIFVNSRRMQKVLSFLIQRKFNCVKPEIISGETQASQRQEIVNRFSILPNFATLILSPRAAGVGLNITSANHVIHLDRWWNPAVEDQCTDRAYRIGATKDVHVYTIGAVHPLLQENSYDVILDNLLRTRREVSKRIFTSSDINAADFAEAINKGANVDPKLVLQNIDRSGYLALEEFVRDQMLSQQLDANMTRRSNDGGADIVVRDELGKIVFLIQCKHTNNIDHPMDAGIADDAARVRDNWRAPSALVIGVTNAKRFAPRVTSEFAKLNGRLIARDDLLSIRLR